MIHEAAERWYKRCGADFIHGTMMLSLEEKGAYSLCLDLIYDRGGPIPDDARWLSGVCGVSLRKWGSNPRSAHFARQDRHYRRPAEQLSRRLRDTFGRFIFARTSRKRSERWT
jgi:uncharacterized protein YdaU (DUF1376 family)